MITFPEAIQNWFAVDFVEKKSNDYNLDINGIIVYQHEVFDAYEYKLTCYVSIRYTKQFMFFFLSDLYDSTLGNTFFVLTDYSLL